MRTSGRNYVVIGVWMPRARVKRQPSLAGALTTSTAPHHMLGKPSIDVLCAHIDFRHRYSEHCVENRGRMDKEHVLVSYRKKQ